MTTGNTNGIEADGHDHETVPALISASNSSPGGSDDRHAAHSSEDPSMSALTLNENGENEKNLAAPMNGGKAKRPAASSMDHLADQRGANKVSVSRGKADFASLERRFSHLSQHPLDLQHTNTRRSVVSGFTRPTKVVSRVSAPDVETGKVEDDDFDLAAVLRSGREKSDQAGIKHKSVGVVWEDLEVIGAGGMKINIRNFLSAITEQFIIPVISLLGLVGYKPFAPQPRTILHRTSGVLKPGEMCLVLGRPGAGCSTFLKSIANQRDGFLHVNGNVEYAGLDWKEMAQTFGG